jgi:integrase/recombinase XerD
VTRKAPHDRLCRPVLLWPRSDQAAWANGKKPSGPFDPRNAGSSWSPATWRKIAAGYGFFLTWLDGRGELDPEAQAAQRLTRERLTAYLEFLKHRNLGHTIHNRIQELGNAMRILAPDRDWTWIGRAASRLRAETVPARDKPSRLRPLDELIAAGLALMDFAETEPGFSPRRRAILYRDGLMIAFLGFNPIRLRNFANIRLQEHLQEDFTVLAIPASEIKGRRRPHEAWIADLLRQKLLRYLQHHRLVLLKLRPQKSHTDHLWVSAEGTPLSEEGIYRRVAKATARSGTRIGPHLFRSCAATTIAIRAPKDIHIITPVLDHSGPRVGERYYNMAGSIEAARAYTKAVDSLRCDKE